MSVIVKGMKKPPKCEWLDENHDIHRCQLLDDDDNCKLQNCDPYWSWYEQYEGCPLIEIPSGVRLIDAKQFVENIRVAKLYRLTGQRDYANAFMNNSGDISTEWWCVEDMIDNAPTIFEEA